MNTLLHRCDELRTLREEIKLDDLGGPSVTSRQAGVSEERGGDVMLEAQEEMRGWECERALKMQEEARRPCLQVASRSCKRGENEFSPEHPEGTQPANTSM